MHTITSCTDHCTSYVIPLLSLLHEQTTQVLQNFPEGLQADISLHLNRDILASNPAFDGCTPGCLRSISLKLRTTHCPPGDFIIHNGDEIKNLYWISRGTAEVLQNDSITAILGLYYRNYSFPLCFFHLKCNVKFLLLNGRFCFCHTKCTNLTFFSIFQLYFLPAFSSNILLCTLTTPSITLRISQLFLLILSQIYVRKESLYSENF